MLLSLYLLLVAVFFLLTLWGLREAADDISWPETLFASLCVAIAWPLCLMVWALLAFESRRSPTGDT